ncbi:MAG TPA: division/cell wall cluster transcriptional repressor MraZ [Azospirillaceae bacterium]|nr:division/cell wall cluster transcriptional repressor MraZ [Azospirillaceae bacterium]
MAVFLSTYVNKIDSKGRVSVPASFRSQLAGPAGLKVVVFPSLQHQALDACSLEHMEQLSESLESPDLPEEEREMIETVIFGSSVELSFDNEGRISLPQHLCEYAGITKDATFVGRRKTFQIWDPGSYRAHETALREKARNSNISLSGIVARAATRAKGGE